MSARTVARTAAPTDRQAARLAGLFAREPELIIAFLESQADAANTATVMAAAALALQQRPSYADLHYCAARAAFETNRLDLARAWLERALELNPRYNDALILAARVAAVQQRREDAMGCLARALKGGADYPDVHVLLGDLRRNSGDIAGARDAYERALSLNPNLVTARESLAALAGAERGGADELPA